jgi:acetyl esterase
LFVKRTWYLKIRNNFYFWPIIYRQRSNKKDMPLDPQTKFFLERMNASHFSQTRNLTPAQFRQAAKVTETPATLEPVAKVENLKIPGPAGHIPIRIYTPSGQGPLPVLVYFHGGGFVRRDMAGIDVLCHRFANLAGCIVVAVYYRLSPEHKFPAAPEDCYAATLWVANNCSNFNGDAFRLAVAGTSAGGNLAAVVAHLGRDRGGPGLVFQLLVVPTTDFTADTPSLKVNGEGYLLTREDIEWFKVNYLKKEEDKNDPLASPLLATNFSGLPPAFIQTAEFDPFRDEGEAYGLKLREAGVPVTVKRYAGAIHGFVVPEMVERATAEGAKALRSIFARK